MSRCFLASLLAVTAFSAAAERPEMQFSPAALRAHVEFLADDLLEGRKAGTRGHEVAARYVATRFEALGLQPANGESWYQVVPMQSSALVPGVQPTLTIGGRVFPHKEDVVLRPSPVAPQQDVAVEAVFAGYCLDKPDQGSDDYAGLDVKGKVLACLAGFPKGMPSDIGAHLSSRRTLMAQEHGAIGVLTIGTRQSAKAFPWPVVLSYADEPQASWIQPDGTPYRLAPDIQTTAYLNTPATEALFGGAPRSYADILEEADREGGKPRGFALAQKVRFSIGSRMTRFESPNVLALLPGADPRRAKEVIVLVAHLDHLGKGHGGTPETVDPGALDNAAGVATLLEVARALAESPHRPARSILFAAVTGEEMGLLGSQYLARNPVVKDARSVAVICLDAPILLYDFTDVIAFGAEHSTLGPAIAKAVARAGVKSSADPLPEQGLFTRSDHYSFVKEGVPGVFLVTGFANGGDKAFGEYLQKYYHQPGDNLKLPIDWKAAARFARINALIAEEAANAQAPPLWYEDSLFAKTYAPNAPKAKRVSPASFPSRG